MWIGILSDTHGVLEAEALEALRGVDEVWHAGDVGSEAVLDALEGLGKPLRAVWGNVDGPEVRARTHGRLEFEAEGMKVLLVHQAGTPGHYLPEVRRRVRARRPDLIVCGHSHILRVERDAAGILYLNPGACGEEGIHRVKTLVRLEVAGGRIRKAEAVELGARVGESRERAWQTVEAFLATRGLRLGEAQASALGRRAARVCREQGWPVNPVHHPRFGTVNEYPVEALEEALTEGLG
ncbi:metallophosphoesterase family protein [Calidithermus chliarophilus]|uniref:metallophosphoesterase family protein n=1 Tax=Calidithermus chliarophilus TaxID=52023 RepID=UPI0004046D37|nr:YfcE family phosphodiesterase [Calidithermus chliarophilus]